MEIVWDRKLKRSRSIQIAENSYRILSTGYSTRGMYTSSFKKEIYEFIYVDERLVYSKFVPVVIAISGVWVCKTLYLPQFAAFVIILDEVSFS